MAPPEAVPPAVLASIVLLTITGALAAASKADAAGWATLVAAKHRCVHASWPIHVDSVPVVALGLLALPGLLMRESGWWATLVYTASDALIMVVVWILVGFVDLWFLVTGAGAYLSVAMFDFNADEAELHHNDKDGGEKTKRIHTIARRHVYGLIAVFIVQWAPVFFQVYAGSVVDSPSSSVSEASLGGLIVVTCVAALVILVLRSADLHGRVISTTAIQGALVTRVVTAVFVMFYVMGNVTSDGTISYNKECN